MGIELELQEEIGNTYAVYDADGFLLSCNQPADISAQQDAIFSYVQIKNELAQYSGGRKGSVSGNNETSSQRTGKEGFFSKIINSVKDLFGGGGDDEEDEDEPIGGDAEDGDMDEDSSDDTDSENDEAITVSVSNNGLSNFGYIQFTAGQLVDLTYINPASINLGFGVNIETEIIHPNFPNNEWNNQMTITPFYSPTISMSVFASEPLSWGILFIIHSDTGLIDINLKS